MPKKRRTFTANFKATVALEALRGQRTITETPSTTAFSRTRSAAGKARPSSMFETVSLTVGGGVRPTTMR